jgi:integrase
MFGALGAEKIDAASGTDIFHPAQMQEVVRNGGDGALVDQRGEAIVDPTTISLPANARARVAGDIVVCAAPPATFAEALELLGASGTLSEARLKDLRRDVAWVEDHRSHNPDGSAPATLPCDPQALRPILKTLKYDRQKTGDKRVYNIKSSLAAIQRKTGWLPPREPRRPIQTAAWASLLGMMDDADLSRPTMRRFAVFCEERNIAPDCVALEQLDAYREALAATNAKAPEQTTCKIKSLWNQLCRDNSDFPGQELPAGRSRLTIRDDANGIPASFAADLDAYLAKLRKPGPFEKGFKGPAAESTMRTRGGVLALAPHRLVKRGWPAASLNSLAAILTPNAVEAILTDYWETNCTEGAWTLGAESTAQALVVAARQWSKLPAAELEQVIDICKQVRAKHRGFTAKKLERLAQFDDPKIERRFLQLPETLWRKALKFAKAGKMKRAADTAKYALSMAILFDKPLRVADLSILDLALDFARNAKGKITGIRISNGRASKRAPVVEGALSAQTVRMLEAYITKFRPVLLYDDSTCLFPGRASGHLGSQSMASQIRTLIARELGVDVNSHLIRAYVGTVILDEDPRAVALAQRVLGHQTDATTLRFYAAQRGRAANRAYAELIERRRRRLRTNVKG